MYRHTINKYYRVTINASSLTHTLSITYTMSSTWLNGVARLSENEPKPTLASLVKFPSKLTTIESVITPQY